MAKVKWPRLGGAYSPRIRGVFLTYPHPLHGFLARKWPRKRPKYPPSVRWNIAQWAELTSSAAQVIDLDYDTAKIWAKGTDFTWRDITSMMQARPGKFVSLTTSDGMVWTDQICMSDNPQFLLDLIDSNVGAMLYRDTVGWIGLDPGANGYVLTLQGGKPLWLPSPTGSNLVQQRGVGVGANISGSFTAGFLGMQLFRLQANQTVNAISAFISAIVATAHITPVIYSLAWPSSATLLARGPTVTGTTAGLNTWPLTSPPTIAADTVVLAGILCRVAAVTIFGLPSAAIYNFAYNTNDTPPSGPITVGFGTASWGGFMLDT